MSEIRYIRLGPNAKKFEYGLSAKKNKDIESSRWRLTSRQSKSGVRDRIEHQAEAHSGYVTWKGKPPEQMVLPYTKAEHEKLRAVEERVAEKLSKLIKAGVITERTPNNNLKHSEFLDQVLTGQTDYEIKFKGNDIFVEKTSDFTRARSLLEANAELRRLENYANRILKALERRAGRDAYDQVRLLLGLERPKTKFREAPLEETVERESGRMAGSEVAAILILASLGILTIGSSGITGAVVGLSSLNTNGMSALSMLLMIISVVFLYFKNKS